MTAQILFKHAHGDLMSILGATIRPFGLTIDDEASKTSSASCFTPSMAW
jgi:hypothetical protein